MDMQTRGAIEMSAAMLISGTIGWLVVVSGLPVTEIVFWRCLFGGAALFVICWRLGLLKQRLSLKTILIAALGGAAIVSNWLLLFASFSYASISIATAIYNTQPFMLVLLGVAFFSERLTLARVIWLMLAFGGVLLVTQDKAEASYVGNGFEWGVLLALAAAFLYALAAIAAKRLKGTSPHLIALIQVSVGAVMLFPLALRSGAPVEAKAWAILVTLGVVHTGTMYILLYGAIQKLPTSRVGALSFIYPGVAIIVDSLAFGHTLHPIQIAGILVILLAAAGVNLGWSLPVRLPTRRTAAAANSSVQER